MRILVLAASAAALVGCASIVSNSTYPVTFDSNPTGAEIRILDESGRVMYQGSAPTTLTLSASDGFFDAASYTVEATMPGYNPGRATINAGLDGWYIGNILLGGLIGMLIVDPATGAMWKLDDRVFVNLGRKVRDDRSATEDRSTDVAHRVRELRIVTPAEVPPGLRRHMVRLR